MFTVSHFSECFIIYCIEDMAAYKAAIILLIQFLVLAQSLYGMPNGAYKTRDEVSIIKCAKMQQNCFFFFDVLSHLLLFLIFLKMHRLKLVQGLEYSLGVPTTSRILTGDSQKLSFSILTKVPFLIF